MLKSKPWRDQSVRGVVDPGLLVAHLGRWETSEWWFHQGNFYGDGVRSLMVGRKGFPHVRIDPLQGLRRSEYAAFCIFSVEKSYIVQ